MTRPAHTATPWQQGRLLSTSTVRQQSKDWIDNADATERRRVFANFRASDEGRSRVSVAVCERPEDADLIVRAVNSFDELVKALELVAGEPREDAAAWMRSVARAALSRAQVQP